MAIIQDTKQALEEEVRSQTPVPHIRSLNKAMDLPWNDPLRKEYAIFKIHNSNDGNAGGVRSLNEQHDVILSQLKDHAFNLPSETPSPSHYKGQDDATSIYPGESHFIMQPRNIHSRAARSSISPKAGNRVESITSSSCNRRDSNEFHISMLPGTSHQILVNPTLLKYSTGEPVTPHMAHFEYSNENGEHFFLESGAPVPTDKRKSNWTFYKEQI